MTRRNDGEPTVKVHLHIFQRDHQRIMEYFGDSLGFSRAARMMLRKFLDNLEAQAEGVAKVVPAADPRQGDLFLTVEKKA